MAHRTGFRQKKRSRPCAAMPPRTRANSFRGTTLFYCFFAKTASLLRRTLLLCTVTAGRCNGRTRRRLTAHALRPRGSETIFGSLYPARFHLAGLSVGTNAKTYSSHHSLFTDVGNKIPHRRQFVKMFRPFSDLSQQWRAGGVPLGFSALWSVGSAVPGGA